MPEYSPKTDAKAVLGELQQLNQRAKLNQAIEELAIAQRMLDMIAVRVGNEWIHGASAQFKGLGFRFDLIYNPRAPRIGEESFDSVSLEIPGDNLAKAIKTKMAQFDGIDFRLNNSAKPRVVKIDEYSAEELPFTMYPYRKRLLVALLDFSFSNSFFSS